MCEADSITVDPHKSGYVPYPAGGLCYKDERSKFLITWTGPYIDGGAGDVESMGVYGLEGSKPGAAPVAVYISNEVIGLHRGGYGALLGEAMFTSVKMYSQWATMSLDSDVLVVTPFIMLPAEREGKSEGEIDEQRRYIKEFITDRPNNELVKDEKAMALVKQMGSDMSINAFACNFRVSRDGPLNTDVAEASYLNARIIERLSVSRVDDDARKKPMMLMGTELEKERYGECLKAFKKRLGLDENDEAPLAGLCNVSMTPFPTAGNFVRELADAFRKVAEEEVQNCWRCIQASAAVHSFIMQGTDKIYLTYLPMFNVGNYRQQLIVSAELPRHAALAYMQAQKASPEAIFTVHTSNKALLASILHERRCTVDIHQGLPIIHGINAEKNGLSLTNVELNNITVIKHTSLAPRHLGQKYPPLMPFFLYGNDKQQHIDHVLLKNPNAQLSAPSVVLQVDPMSINAELREGDIVILNDIREVATQPYGRSHHPDFFAPGRTFDISIYTDPFRDQHGIEPLHIHTLFDKLDLDQPKARGKLTLGNSVYVDDMHLNRDTVPELCITPKEQLTRDQLLLSVTEDYQTITEDITRVSSHSNALAAPDIEQHFLQMSYLPEKYALQRTSSLVEAAEAVHVSRFAMRQPSDGYSRVMAMRQGWKDAFNKALVEHEVRSANV
ncbi:uncharacterized protein LAESUDRAFT_667508 [Laetiporus sulphureus 93-53]|uniref:Uncharacterized protein n=1 Tax=Laetiporus sulphureus 93-53 TaxID=1314785 RepID=A0A165AXA3_9APHY|nr:uncharacterized protein LAESUDRAFT_667508 [Laetiporus sulphureus 93-53]KZS99831.1 hypothetical protein LAESUDRAFT_667508 [Laetiporus sulphureus 93-53]